MALEPALGGHEFTNHSARTRGEVAEGKRSSACTIAAGDTIDLMTRSPLETPAVNAEGIRRASGQGESREKT